MNRPEPLTPEERELARLLGRPATSAPSARVDEAVLAAARAAVGAGAPVAAADPAPGPTAARAPRRRTRLPAVLGVAASVVFAVGIAWQLKFDDPTTASAPPPAVEVAADSAAPAAEPVEAPAAARVAAESPAEAPAITESAPARNAPPAAAAPPAPVKPLAPASPPAAPVEAPAPAAEAFSADTYSAAPPPPAPAQAPAETAAASAAEERVALDAIQVTGSKIETPRAKSALRAQRAAPAASARGEMPAPAAAMTAPADFGGQPESSAITTAVDADALLPRRQWIERIRERRDAGDLDTARASLKRYLQHYPEVRVPRDLRALLDS